MQVKITARYTDTQLKRVVEVGEVLDVTEKRGATLINAKVGEAITEPTPTPEVVTRGKGKKKKEV